MGNKSSYHLDMHGLIDDFVCICTNFDTCADLRGGGSNLINLHCKITQSRITHLYPSRKNHPSDPPSLGFWIILM